MREGVKVALGVTGIVVGTAVGATDLVHLPGMRGRPSPEAVGEAFDDAHQAFNEWDSPPVSPEEADAINTAIDRAFADGRDPTEDDFTETLRQKTRANEVNDHYRTYKDTEERYVMLQGRSVGSERGFNALISFIYANTFWLLSYVRIERVRRTAR